MRRRIGALLLAGCVIPAVARADHHGMAMPAGDDTSMSFGASVSVLAASYGTMDFAGGYHGVVPAASWSMGRYAAGASFAYYRLDENGAQQQGWGDTVAHAQVALVRDRATQAGVMLAVSLPTGDDQVGLGMGHQMLMPAAWGAWRRERLVLAASAGYSRALVDAGSHHDHGPWPLVEPMNMSELTWNGSCELALGEGLRAGARLSGGIPIGALPGHERVVGAVRFAWGAGRFDTAAELQAGLAGDPFILRALVSTALRF